MSTQQSVVSARRIRDLFDATFEDGAPLKETPVSLLSVSSEVLHSVRRTAATPGFRLTTQAINDPSSLLSPTTDGNLLTMMCGILLSNCVDGSSNRALLAHYGFEVSPEEWTVLNAVWKRVVAEANVVKRDNSPTKKLHAALRSIAG